MPSPDPPAPFPIGATHFLGQVAVTFDRPLIAGPLANGNWTGRFGNQLFTVVGANVPGGAIANMTIVAGVADAGPDVVSYAAAPPDVRGLPDTVPAVAFADFPIV